MKRLLAILCLALSCTTLAAPSQHFLWQAQKGSQKVWLMGSVHMGRADFFPLPKAAEDAYQQAGSLAVEADVSDPMVTLQLVSKAVLPSSDSLGQHLSAEQSARLDRALAEVGMPRNVAERMKPWYVAMALDAMEMQHLGLATEEGIDLYFLHKAKKDQKPIVELESAASQIELFDNMPEGDTVALLDVTLDEINKGQLKQELDDMLAAWKAGDVAAMRKVIDDDSPDDPAIKRINDKLFGERNHAMADKIAAMASKKVPFVVIGAGHLVSADNVLDLLRKRGFKLTQY